MTVTGRECASIFGNILQTIHLLSVVNSDLGQIERIKGGELEKGGGKLVKELLKAFDHSMIFQGHFEIVRYVPDTEEQLDVEGSFVSLLEPDTWIEDLLICLR